MSLKGIRTDGCSLTEKVRYLNMKIVIAPDSFKGSVSAEEAAIAIDRGIKKVHPNIETVLLPVADGGEGTMESLVAATKGRKVEATVSDPFGNPITAEYGLLGNQKTCVVEMASASGLCLISTDSLNPMIASTYGTGELIKKALDDGYRNFIVAIGGSATNDGGIGLLQALGMKMLDEFGNPVGCGGEALSKIQLIDDSHWDQRIKESTFLIASDVQNPMVGKEGASYIFGPQKGATLEMVKSLDDGMRNWADVIEGHTGVQLHDLPGAGAAGGVGGALVAFFPSSIKRGIDTVLEYAELNQALEKADLVITGEGQIDYQTASGKTPMGVAQAAQKKGIPTIVLTGSIGDGIETLYQYGIKSVHSIVNGPMTLDDAIEKASDLLTQTAEQVIRVYFCGFNGKQ